MQLVITRVKLRPGSVDACAELFRKTNPDLVRNQSDWLGAQLSVDRENNVVTVIASWRNIAGYEALRQTPAFQETMGRFVPLFAAPPEITVSDVLVDMTPESVAEG